MSFCASIVIPLRKQTDNWLKQCVESALMQTVKCDVVVVTSPVTPESNRSILERLQKQFSDLRVIEREPHMRFAAALNLGIRNATADRIAFLLSDDWLQRKAVETCLRHDADIVSTSRRFYAADGATELKQLRVVHTVSRWGKLHDDAARAKFLGYFFLFRRAALARAGGVDETLGDSPGIDDFDLIWTMLERRSSVAIVEERLYNVRDHAGERLTTRNGDEMLATFERILDKHRVVGEERERMVREDSRWFGRTIESGYREIVGRESVPQMHPARRVYRALVPFETRLVLHERVMKLLGR